MGYSRRLGRRPMEQASKSAHGHVINDQEVQPFIDPEDIARLKRIERLKLTLPVRNVALKDQPTLTASVRLALYEFFAQKMDGTSLLDTLKWFVFEEYGPPCDDYVLASCPEC